MAAVLHRVTKQYLPSANTPDYPTQDWIINPNLSAVIGFDSRYWKINGDTVSLMTQGERDAVDAASLATARNAAAAQLQQQEDILRALMLLVLDEFNAHTTAVNGIGLAIANGASLAAIKTAIQALTPLSQRTEQQLRDAIRAKLGG